MPSAIDEVVKGRAIPPSVRILNLAGEALAPSLVERIQQAYPEVTLNNLYGPSEDTTYSTVLRLALSHKGAVRLGRPIAGTQLYLLDAELNPVPPGARGTIYVAGNGLARGYFENPAATAAAFLPDPFGPAPGARMYVTGDLGRLSATGNVEYLGRSDDRVKPRLPSILTQGSSTIEAVSYFVVKNHEDQYSIWPSFKAVPAGWEVLRDPARA